MARKLTYEQLEQRVKELEREANVLKQTEAEIRDSARRYRTLLDFVPYPMVVYTINGHVSYLNPSFTEVFGWTQEELEGKKIPFVPPELQQETSEKIRKLFKERIMPRYETKRSTKDGRIRDVITRGAVFSKSEMGLSGELVIFRDITHEKRMARNNETMLRISMTLPEHPDLADLLDYISNEVKRLLGTEGALVTLLDEERDELFFLGAAYDDTTTQERVKEIRFPIDQIASGKVIRTGEPLIVSDASKDSYLYPERDKKLGYHTKNYISVPLKSGDRIIGAIAAINKREGTFEQIDVEFLSIIAGTAALSIENARVSEEIKKSYREVTSLNRAKDKIFHHLSHELKTPVSVLNSSLVTLARRLKTLPQETWKRSMERAQRNLERILEIQYQVEDIMRDKDYKAYTVFSSLLDQCADELEALIAEEVGEAPVIEKVRKRIEEIFGPKESVPEEVQLDKYVDERLEALKPSFSHRQVQIIRRLKPAPSTCIPLDVLQKVVDGLIKNAIENTPDEGGIEVMVEKKGEGSELVVSDYGMGITEEDQRRIFEGFFTTRDTMAYSTKKPFDFGAGGKGGDMLRMKIFSERYNFKIDMNSSRCPCLPSEHDTCPGRISNCSFCRKKKDCHSSGGTTFSLYFTPARGRRQA